MLRVPSRLALFDSAASVGRSVPLPATGILCRIHLWFESNCFMSSGFKEFQRICGPKVVTYNATLAAFEARSNTS